MSVFIFNKASELGGILFISMSIYNLITWTQQAHVCFLYTLLKIIKRTLNVLSFGKVSDVPLDILRSVLLMCACCCHFV